MLVKETYEDYPVVWLPEGVVCTIRQWVFYYDDGSIETVTMRKPNEKS